ncbi:hypothetical protein [Pseudonocardia acaciae]|uniref:hypothetical protein n=1 Tax=Pseudonocardia acaciae TaxID=551276 RepID=UPI00048A8E99|nr:hypothetical protein [Pseudonocardia acaciae]
MYFAAGTSHRHYPRHTLIAVNDIEGDAGERVLCRMLDEGLVLLLDSGIFALTNAHMRRTGCTMDEALALAPEEIPGFDELFDRYVHLAGTYGERLWGYIELDQGGRDNKRRTRARLHELGLRPIPVYHPLNDGWGYFDELAATHDRVCFGNVVQASMPARVRLLHTMWERRRQYPDLWVHVLGLSASEWCLPCPPDSCDSSTWINALRYPTVKTESSALRRLGDLGPGFQYVVGHNPDNDRFAASKVYADTMTHTNLVWRIMQQRVTELGAPPHPPRREKEGPLCPAR